MSIEPNDPRPPYQQVADDLRRKIRQGTEYAAGARLPSIRHLAKQYGISPQTVQSALRELRQEHLVVSQQGRAFFVRDPDRPIVGDPAGEDHVIARLAALEAELHNLQGKVETIEHDSELARQVAALQVQMMDLYGRMGQPYPHESPTAERSHHERTG